MYLKNIAIKNIGAISELSIELPFDINRNPKPLILVGENGTGKTIFQSQIIDSFYEIASELFDDVGIKNGLKKSYYKVSGGTNLKTNEEKGFSALKFVDLENNKIEYFDKIGNINSNDIKNLIIDFSLFPNGKDGNQKLITDVKNNAIQEKLMKEWIKEVHIFQPAYRYEEPFWKNRIFQENQRFEDKKRYTGKLGKEIEIISSTIINKSYLMDLVLDYLNEQTVIDTAIWKNINTILRAIKKKNNIRFGVGPRGRYRVSIVETDDKGNVIKQLLESIDNLSLGESILLNLFINIIRHADQPPRLNDEITGIVAIDEIDVHLHTDLQNTVLPQLIKMFPKIQFIITTHSPLFILGMKKEFGEDGFEIRNMPNGEKITTERFSEFENAYNILKNTTKFEDDLKLNILKNTKPIVYVEGPTDVLYIKKAYELYEKSTEDFDIEIIGEKTSLGTKNSNNKALSNAQKLLSTNLNLLKQKVILLNDPEESIEEKDYENILHIRKMPQFSHNPLQKGIENLFEKEFIDKVEEKFPNDFSFLMKSGNKQNFKIDSNKQTICNWICKNGTKDDFRNFEMIFKTIEKCLGNNL
ncbi:AAA family ATPase [Aliarcobacter cryaerophilus]|uniref:AAA family ATPase n=1 Tax=Aliarcobacter cryaerophilus TaxID=28198 RepID=UPI003DA39499